VRPACQGQRGRRGADLLALVALLATAAVIAWPILRGGYLTYLDNPVHLAEAHALAFEAYGGWSEIAWCGFPLGHIHSPIWYGILAWLARFGLPLDPLYVACVWLGFAAPALALYVVVRRRLRALGAASLAYLLMIQRPAIVGIGSALGGMWTFYLAAGGLVLLADRLASRGSGRRYTMCTAGLVGLVLSTHFFAAIPVAVLFVQSTLSIAVHPDGARMRRLRSLTAAGALGLVAAAVYWLPIAMAWSYFDVTPQTMAPGLVLARLLLPTDAMDLLTGTLAVSSDLVYVDALPMVLLCVGGVIGTTIWFHDGRAGKERDRLTGLGMGLALVMLLLTTVIAPVFKPTFLGHVSWRLLYFVRVGLVLACLPAVAGLEAWVRSRVSWTAARGGKVIVAGCATVAVVAGFWWQRPLARLVPVTDGSEMAEVVALWDWLHENRDESWGRVYLQDTFFTPPRDRALVHSHILSLTARETGVRQLGAYYGAVPVPTRRWTLAEFGALFGAGLRSQAEFTQLVRRMRLSNTTHLVVANPVLVERLLATGGFTQDFRRGRFSVLRLENRGSRWIEPSTAELQVADVGYETGRIVLRTRAVEPGGAVLIKTAFHPYWRVQNGSRARVAPSADGLLMLVEIEPGLHSIALEYRPPRLPKLLAAAGWLVIVLGLSPRRTRESRGG